MTCGRLNPYQWVSTYVRRSTSVPLSLEKAEEEQVSQSRPKLIAGHDNGLMIQVLHR